MTTKPNVLLICVDHWPGSLLGCEGHPAVLTPTLDQLAANGVRFTNAYSAAPVCIPARRTLMTGTDPRTHGMRTFEERVPMPSIPTLAGTFAAAGYQCYAVGKLHVYPQRDRIGFHDVILNEEGRHHLGMQADDFELFLAEQGFAGQEFAHGMPSTDYMTRPWHLPEYCHHTNWTSREMSKVIRRRDPTRPSFWYMSFNFPHPPLVPLQEYMNLYQDAPIPPAHYGNWAGAFDTLPYALQDRANRWYPHTKDGKLHGFELRLVRQAFYALCTHIDHQIRSIVGFLREEGLLADTIIAFTSDHGDMLGNHGFFAKGLHYEDSARVPLIIMPTASYDRLPHHHVDDRLTELMDIMPTLLDMAGIPIPETVTGRSLVGEDRREHLFCEYRESTLATRMVRNDRFKLIYYPAGNHFQLFDLEMDPNELCNLADDPDYVRVKDELILQLSAQLYGSDLDWIQADKLVGLPKPKFEQRPNRGLTAQRGLRLI